MPSRGPITIEVEIRKEKNHHGEVWSVEPKKKENDARVKLHKKHILGKWNNRHPKKRLALVIHRPIVIFEGETLKFTCPDGFQFAIGAKKNSDVDEFPDAPDNPFGWKGFQIVKKGRSVSAKVISTGNGPGPKYQAFYKFHGWVRTAPDVFEPVDPDGYCGS